MKKPFFPGQKEDEIIELIVRKHWMIFVFLFLKIIIIIGAPLALMVLLTSYSLIPSDYLRISWAFFLVYLLYSFLITYIGWLNEELDTVIITNERIINVDQVSFLHRVIAETSLAHLSDVRGNQKGIWGDLFNYGIIELFSGTHKSISRIEYVGNTFEVTEKILEVRNEFHKRYDNSNRLKEVETDISERVNYDIVD